MFVRPTYPGNACRVMSHSALCGFKVLTHVLLKCQCVTLTAGIFRQSLSWLFAPSNAAILGAWSVTLSLCHPHSADSCWFPGRLAAAATIKSIIGALIPLSVFNGFYLFFWYKGSSLQVTRGSGMKQLEIDLQKHELYFYANWNSEFGATKLTC